MIDEEQKSLFFSHRAKQKQKAKITSLQRQLNQREQQLNDANQQLAQAREVQAAAVQEHQRLQAELLAMREDLKKVWEQLRQAQAKLRERLEKVPELEIEQLAEKLEQKGIDLVKVEALTQKGQVDNSDLTEIKEQVQEQITETNKVIARAAHLCPTAEELQSQLPVTINKTTTEQQPKTTNYFPYIIGGIGLLGVIGLIIGYVANKSKKGQK